MPHAASFAVGSAVWFAVKALLGALVGRLDAIPSSVWRDPSKP